MFSLPGEFSFPLGLQLNVYDICDASTFPSAPVLSGSLYNYYMNQGDLVVALTWAKDTVYESTTIACGSYTVNADINTGSSVLVTAIDSALTYDEEIDDFHLKFFSN